MTSVLSDWIEVNSLDAPASLDVVVFLSAHRRKGRRAIGCRRNCRLGDICERDDIVRMMYCMCRVRVFALKNGAFSKSSAEK